MSGWRQAVFRPLSPSMFGGPGKLLEAGLHGPASGATSLLYPLPSTLAGALARAVAGNLSCDGRLGGLSGDFDDLDCVLEAALGEDFSLKAGLARGEDGKYYVYVGEGLVEIDRVSEYVKTRLEGRKVDGLLYRPRKAGYTGIALDRRTKTVDEGMLYHVELVDYASPRRLEIVLPFKGKASRTVLDYVRLGGEGSMAAVSIEGQGLDPSKNLCRASKGALRILLVAPALLEPPREGSADYIVGGSISSGERLAKWLSSSLLEQAEIRCGNLRLSRMLVPSNDLELSIVYPGWTFKNMPRKPHIIVPAGTIMELEVEDPRACCEKLAEKGVGAHSRLGWGTVVVVPKG